MIFDVVLGRVFNAIPQMVPDDSGVNDICVHVPDFLLLCDNVVVIHIIIIVVDVVVVEVVLKKILFYLSCYRFIVDFLCMLLYLLPKLAHSFFDFIIFGFFFSVIFLYSS